MSNAKRMKLVSRMLKAHNKQFEESKGKVEPEIYKEKEVCFNRMLLSLSWCKVLLFVLAIVFQRKLTNLENLPDRSSMYKAFAEELDLEPWVDFGFHEKPDCRSGWEPILAIQELNGIKIETNNLF